VDCPHEWQLIAVGSKVWVNCKNCTKRFPFTTEFNGTPYKGPIPERYR